MCLSRDVGHFPCSANMGVESFRTHGHTSLSPPPHLRRSSTAHRGAGPGAARGPEPRRRAMRGETP